jgi:membrane associated rhomboid family serine protease
VVPLRDENPTTTTPYVTYGLIGVNVLIFLFELTLSQSQLSQFFQTWAVVPKELTDSFQGVVTPAYQQEWLTLITSQFLHAGILHVGGNMLYLWIFGNNIEDRLGHVKFILFYLLCGVCASLTQWFFDSTSTIPSLGASGAIAGVMGAYILRYPGAKVVTLLPLGFFITIVRIPAIVFLGIWFIQQAFYGVASLGATANVGMEGGGIAYWAHAGGFVIGAVLGVLFGLLGDRPSDSNSI